MKKLNRKGFTLIELLAIIVILAIIMVVTIPTILGSINSSTTKTFKNSADAIEKWVSDEYVLASVGETGTSMDNFTKICGKTGSTCTVNDGVTITAADAANGFKSDSAVDNEKYMYAFLQAAGQKPSNYSEVYVKVDASTNRVCVKLKASTNGDFGGVAYDSGNSSMEVSTKDGEDNVTSFYIKSNGC